MASIARTHSIYTLAYGDSVFYVGKTLNPKERLYYHQSAARRGDSYKVYQYINENGPGYHMAIIDHIHTSHTILALKLESCWIWELRNQGCTLYNDWSAAVCVDHNNPMRIATIVKGFASVPKGELSRLRDIEMQIAYALTFE